MISRRNKQIAQEILTNTKSLSDKSLKRKWTKLYETIIQESLE